MCIASTFPLFISCTLYDFPLQAPCASGARLLMLQASNTYATFLFSDPLLAAVSESRDREKSIKRKVHNLIIFFVPILTTLLDSTKFLIYYVRQTSLSFHMCNVCIIDFSSMFSFKNIHNINVESNRKYQTTTNWG